jgi:hypothetical protein
MSKLLSDINEKAGMDRLLTKESVAKVMKMHVRGAVNGDAGAIPGWAIDEAVRDVTELVYKSCNCLNCAKNG